MKFEALKSCSILLWGVGRETLSFLDCLQLYSPKKTVFIWDDNEIPQQRVDALQKYEFDIQIVKALDSDLFDQIDIIVKSPGVSLYSASIEAAKSHGVQVTSATNIWFDNFAGNKKTIAITGTKGKSTTASLIHHLLQKLGLKSVIAGNIGQPLLALHQNDADIIVMELSSYQTADLQFHPDIAVLMNLFPEHVEWHGNHVRYYQDKLNMFSEEHSECLYNGKDKNSRQFISPKWFDYNGKQVSLPFLSHEWAQPDHIQQNIKAAYSVIEKLGFDIRHQLDTFLADFQTLPSRLEKIACINGISFVDDCLATTPETVIAALSTYQDQPIHLILGGHNRQQDISTLSDFLKTADLNLKQIYCVGEVTDEWHDALKENIRNIDCQKIYKLDIAVQSAFHAAEEGDVVLLSPAAPSYDQYQNYIAKSKHFRDLVQDCKEPV